MPLEPAETRPRSNFPESGVSFSKVRSAKLNTDVTIITAWHRLYFGEIKPHLTSHTCQHHAEITQSHTFAALIRLSTTTHNLLTFNIGEISSNNSERRSVLANKHLWTFLSHSSYASCRMYSHALSGKHIKPVFTRKKKQLSLGLGHTSAASLLSPNSFDS